jgi:AAA domain
VTLSNYNAQVFEIRRRIPGARVGTVDKFQGQEAAIAIYSIATSSHADAPGGIEFLYSPNRLNVRFPEPSACRSSFGSPRIFEAECRTPRQMQLANAFCRFLEMAVHLDQKIWSKDPEHIVAYHASENAFLDAEMTRVMG